jgi:tRNA-(ms[2]io[6]A)-hydroxylase
MDLSKYADLLAPIYQFLRCETPDSWIVEAAKPSNLNVILIDHMHCELKAAQSAALLIRKYAVDNESAGQLLSWLKPYEDFVYRKVGDGQFGERKNALIGELGCKDKSEFSRSLLDKMVRLIKEELHHFEQVLEIIQTRNVEITNMPAAGYASGLIRHVRTYEPQTLIDKLIIGAFIEARSCERFAKLAPFLDDELAKFYVSLLRSEARHYQDYIELAKDVAANHGIAPNEVDQRVCEFAEIERSLIESTDPLFRFHSGVPA